MEEDMRIDFPLPRKEKMFGVSRFSIHTLKDENCGYIMLSEHGEITSARIYNANCARQIADGFLRLAKEMEKKNV